MSEAACAIQSRFQAPSLLTPRYSLGIVGSGRVAQALGAALRDSGMPVDAIAARRPGAAQNAAAFAGAAAPMSIEDIAIHCTHLIVAVADDAVAEVSHRLAEAGLREGIILHTCGSSGPALLGDLRKAGNAVGVLHPLQTIPDGMRGSRALPGSAFAYGGDTAAKEFAATIIQQLNGRRLEVKADGWQHYHAAAVMACNYPVALVDAALGLLQHAGIGGSDALNALAPLIRSTIENLLSSSPDAALTGPIRRGDASTVRRHMQALAASPEDRALYACVGKRTLALAQRAGLPADAAARVSDVLEGR